LASKELIERLHRCERALQLDSAVVCSILTHTNKFKKWKEKRRTTGIRFEFDCASSKGDRCRMIAQHSPPMGPAAVVAALV
jgi:hypothetical protein